MTTPTQTLLAALWQKNRPQVLARLDLLEQAAAAAKAGTLTTEQQAEAAATAHKLAGSLGMYGFPAGTAAARLLEQEFESATPNATNLKDHVAALLQALG